MSVKKAREPLEDAREVLNEQAEDEGYNRYKSLCYQNLILEALLGFLIGILLAFLFS